MRLTLLHVKNKKKIKANKEKISHFYRGSERSDICLISLLAKKAPHIAWFLMARIFLLSLLS